MGVHRDGPVRIVLVERDPQERMRLATALRIDGCLVDEASGVAEAATLFRFSGLPGQRVDLVASDLRERAVVDLVSAMRGRGWDLPLVGFFGCTAEHLRREVRARLAAIGRLAG